VEETFEGLVSPRMKLSLVSSMEKIVKKEGSESQRNRRNFFWAQRRRCVL